MEVAIFGRDRQASPLKGQTLLLAEFVLVLSDFMVVLDTTFANIAVPRISGSLGIASSQRAWIITSYSAAEAFCVPLTGWLAARFGTVRIFVGGMIGFACFFTMCGLSASLAMDLALRAWWRQASRFSTNHPGPDGTTQ